MSTDKEDPEKKRQVKFKVLDLGIEESDKELILVVDDEPSLQSVMFDILCDDYRIIAAHNGREGITKAENAQPKVILMDVMMPDMGGYEAVRKLQENPKTAQIPIIMITSMGFDPSTVDMIKAEPNVRDFLPKPFRPNQLRDIIKSTLKA